MIKSRNTPQFTAAGWIILLAIVAISLMAAVWTAAEIQRFYDAFQSGRGIPGTLSNIIRMLAAAAGGILFAFIPYFIASSGRRSTAIYWSNLAIILLPFFFWNIGWSVIAWIILIPIAIFTR